MVSEAGASVYSASAYASAELPDLDVSLRGAVSIARRLQDPLAELVKIDPKSIGVGQYQHDLAESALVALARRRGRGLRERRRRRRQHRVRCRCCAGSRAIAEALATQIVAHRDANGPFRTRTALADVPRLGPEGVRAVRGLPAHPRRRRPARRLRRAPGGLPGRAPDRRERAKTDVAALIGNAPSCESLQPARLRRRRVRPADRHRHPRRAGEARPRPAPGVPHRDVRRGRAQDRRPAAGDGARGRGHQRRRVRRVRRRRRAPGRARARLGDVDGSSSATRARS